MHRFVVREQSLQAGQRSGRALGRQHARCHHRPRAQCAIPIPARAPTPGRSTRTESHHMQSRDLVLVGGASLIAGAVAFVAVFSYLAANFDYPRVLDGAAADVLPRLRAGGARMRAVWAVYSVLPLLLILGAIGAGFAFPSSRGLATLGVVFATVGSLAMCLGLMRWPSVHWVLAEAYESGGAEARQSIAAVFSGLNLYLGNYIGEFLGEVCLGIFFLASALALRGEPHFPAWLGVAGILFAVLFFIGALRNAAPQVQAVADLNNYLLPLWLVVLGGAIVWFRPPA
ncbi:MAG: DUF4386 domain-containing protein [Piscinibacter sp.]